jgi:hypothetical protein
MPGNLAAAAVTATAIWTISAWTIITHDGAARHDFWTVTSSDKNPRHPTLVRASVPRSLATAQETHVARRLRVAQTAAK